MKLTQKIMGALGVAALAGTLLSVPVQAASMAAARPSDYGIRCEAGVCALKLDLGEYAPAGGIRLEVNEENLTFLPDGAGVEVADDLVLRMPVGDIALLDADLALTLGADQQVEGFHGTARVPMPRLGLLTGNPGEPAEVKVGFGPAAELAELDAPLDPAGRYLYFNVDSGLDLSATVPQADGSEGALALSVPRGQRATIVIDPADKYVFVDGNLTIRYAGALTMLADLMDPAALSSLSLADLPLNHAVALHVAGGVDLDELNQSSLAVGAAYELDPGIVGQWLHFDGTPLTIEGAATLDGEGLLVNGIVRSEIAPETVLDGSVAARLYVPFAGAVEKAYATVEGKLDLPFVDVEADGAARVDSDLNLLAAGGVRGPEGVQAGGVNVSVDPNTEEGQGFWQPVLAATRAAVESGAAWAWSGAQDGYGAASEGATSAYAAAAARLCGLTGVCQP